MGYVVINGKRSTLVKGLLIQSLPMISKPMMRTSIETIDGRDGDIVLNRGYAAYDKTLKIGLFGDYDLDEVIRFFDQSGKVIFSNEPDKFYNFTVIKQIDFEKLLRFKQADVVFHVQPFKYSAVDDSMTVNTTGLTSITVFNRGNVDSRPTLTIKGSGYVSININDVRVIEVSNVGTVIIDGEGMNAYEGGELINRRVIGDYNKLRLKSGINTISWTGTVNQISLEKFARWI